MKTNKILIPIITALLLISTLALAGSELTDQRWLLDNETAVTDYYINISDGNSPKFIIDPAGQVGIGTVSPGSLLDVNGVLQISDAGTQRGLLLTNSATAGEEDALVFVANTDDFIFRTSTTGGTNERMRILNSGNVGIGTTTPNAKLEIQDSTGTLLNITDGNAGGFGDILFVNNSFVGVSTSVPLTKFNVVGETYIEQSAGGRSLSLFVTGNNARIGHNSASQLDIGEIAGQAGSGWNSRITLLNGGNVGIGTTNPSSSWGGNKVLAISGATVPSLVLNSTSSNQEVSMSSGGNGLYFDVGGHATASGNNDIIFRTEETDSQLSPTEKVRITSGGTVSINTTTPDSNTAFHVEGGDVRFNGTGDSEGFYYNSTSGNVGIGTTGPEHNLEIGKSGSVYLALNSDTDGNYEVATKYNNYNTGTNWWWTGINNENDYNIAYGTELSAENTKLFVETTGNVGINTTSPNGTLDVVGQVFVSGGSETFPAYTFAGDTDTGIYTDTSDNIKFSSGAANVLIIRPMDIILNLVDFNLNNGRLLGDDDANSSLKMFATFHPDNASSYISFTTGIVDAMYIDGRGNVGINTTIPTSTFEVVGTANISDHLFNSTTLGLVGGLSAIGNVEVDGTVYVRTAGDRGVLLRSSGAVPTSPAISFSSETDSGFFNNVDGIFGASVDSTPIMYFKPEGIGINTSSITALLDLQHTVGTLVNVSAGNVGFGDILKVNNSDVVIGFESGGGQGIDLYSEGGASWIRHLGASDTGIQLGAANSDNKITRVSADGRMKISSETTIIEMADDLNITTATNPRLNFAGGGYIYDNGTAVIIGHE